MRDIFVDTAAFLAVLNSEDQYHPAARQAWEDILASAAAIISSNYVILETIAILQNRFGMRWVKFFESEILPVVDLQWVDESIHNQGLSALLTANRRSLSLVDCTSFEIIRRLGLELSFTFDPHYLEQGFEVIPDPGIGKTE
jgi:predicted nucleic acid-binding protein